MLPSAVGRPSHELLLTRLRDYRFSSRYNRLWHGVTFLIFDTLVKFAPKADGSLTSARPCYLQCVLPRLCLNQHRGSLLSVPQPAPFWTRARSVERSCSAFLIHTAALLAKTFPLWSTVCSLSSKDQLLSTTLRFLRSSAFQKLGSFTKGDRCHSLTSILGLVPPCNNGISNQIRTPHAHCMLSCQ